jgi:hypothetical protein
MIKCTLVTLTLPHNSNKTQHLHISTLTTQKRLNENKMSSIIPASLTLSKSQKRRLRKKTLEGKVNPSITPSATTTTSGDTVNGTAGIKEKEIKSASDQTTTVEPEWRLSSAYVEGVGMVSSLKRDPWDWEESARKSLTWQQRCIDHTHYVLKLLKIKSLTSRGQLELVQDHPEMYFRKAFIVYAAKEPVSCDVFTDSPSVSEQECLVHCKTLIQDFNTRSLEEITENRLMIYRKSIIRKALSAL